MLAAAFPLCSVVLLDRNRHSLARAQRRALEAGLTNVTTYCADISEFELPFNVGIALHFCGFLTDLALEKCITHGAAYVLCPCCYGKIGHEATIHATSCLNAGMESTPSVPAATTAPGAHTPPPTALAAATCPASEPFSDFASRLVHLPRSSEMREVHLLSEGELIALAQHCDFSPTTLHDPHLDVEVHDLQNPLYVPAHLHRACMSDLFCCWCSRNHVEKQRRFLV